MDGRDAVQEIRPDRGRNCLYREHDTTDGVGQHRRETEEGLKNPRRGMASAKNINRALFEINR